MKVWLATMRKRSKGWWRGARSSTELKQSRLFIGRGGAVVFIAVASKFELREIKVLNRRVPLRRLIFRLALGGSSRFRVVKTTDLTFVDSTLV